MTDAGGSTASFYANDGNAATPFGALYQNCWLRNSDGNWFYANAGGDLAADWFYQDGTWYYLNPATHIMQVGFVDLGSGKYYLDATGAMKTGWILVDGNWYWAYPSGALASSWQTIGGTRYYFDSQTLAMFKGRHEIDGSTYIFGDYGLVNGWFKDGVDWYYCSNGIAVTGWQLVNGTWYYLDPASDADQDNLLLESCKIPQNRRKQDSSLTIHLTRRGTCQKETGEFSGILIGKWECL